MALGQVRHDVVVFLVGGTSVQRDPQGLVDKSVVVMLESSGRDLEEEIRGVGTMVSSVGEEVVVVENSEFDPDLGSSGDG